MSNFLRITWVFTVGSPFSSLPGSNVTPQLGSIEIDLACPEFAVDWRWDRNECPAFTFKIMHTSRSDMGHTPFDGTVYLFLLHSTVLPFPPVESGLWCFYIMMRTVNTICRRICCSISFKIVQVIWAVTLRRTSIICFTIVRSSQRTRLRGRFPGVKLSRSLLRRWIRTISLGR